MPDHTLPIITLVAMLGSGVVAGTFYGFSSFVMGALGKLPPPQGIAAMQSINVVVINPWFMVPFIGTAVLCLGLVVTSFVTWQRPGTGWMLAGALLYIVGTFVVTIAFNVPRNDALAAVDANSAAGAELWANYLRTWTTWNTVRTIAGLLAMVAFAMAFTAMSGFTPSTPAETR
jgi:uncharacterized membrane protein